MTDRYQLRDDMKARLGTLSSQIGVVQIGQGRVDRIAVNGGLFSGPLEGSSVNSENTAVTGEFLPDF